MIKYALGLRRWTRVRQLVSRQRRLREATQAWLCRLPRMRLDPRRQGDHGPGRRWRRSARRRSKRAQKLSSMIGAASAREFFLRMRREIEANTDDVGAKFPQVARAIHLGEEPERAIRGRASLAEAKSSAGGRHRRAAAADAGGRTQLAWRAPDSRLRLRLSAYVSRDWVACARFAATSHRCGTPAPRPPSCRSSCAPTRGRETGPGRWRSAPARLPGPCCRP